MLVYSVLCATVSHFFHFLMSPQIPFGPVLCVCPIIRPRFTVIIAKSAQDDKKEEIEDLMKIIQNQSLTLECAVRDIE